MRIQTVCMHMEWCAHRKNEVMCMHCLASQKSLGLVMLLLLEWTPADPLCCCGRDCWVGSILPSWVAAMLGCNLYFCWHVVARGRWGLLPPPPASRWGLLPPPPASRWGDFVPHPPVGVLPTPRQALGCPTHRCVVVVARSRSRQVHVCLFLSVRVWWPKFAPQSGSRCLPLPLRKLRSPSPLQFVGLFCPSGTGLASFGCKRLVKHTASTWFLAVAILTDDVTHTHTHAHTTHTHTHTHRDSEALAIVYSFMYELH